MLNLFCSNTECRWAKEHKGGRFVWLDGKSYCEDCVKFRGGLNAKSAFDFETDHLVAGKKVHVTSLRHLQQLEKQHGVVSVAANYDRGNQESPPQTKAGLQYHRRFHG